jgi:predicted metal-dependent hydrolase
MRNLYQLALDFFEPEPRVVAPTPVKKSISPQFSGVKTAVSHESIAQAATESIADVISPARFRHPRANRESRLCNALVGYEFKRGQRRTIGFQVGPDGLVVSAPKWVPLREVEAALQEKAPWVLRKLDEMREREQRQASARIEWRDGVTLPFLGDTLTVVLDPSHAFTAVGGEHAAGTLRIGLPLHATPDQIRDAVQAWLMRQAKQLFTERLNHFAPQLQVQWRKLSLSNAGTRWGSARIDGSIRLNWRLIHFKQNVIDYVVAHELSHLRVMDHSPRFWDTVRTVVPDYASLRGQLKDDAVPRWA